MYKRVLLKLSGEALSGEGNNFDPKVLANLAEEIKEIQASGVEIAIVVGGGNFIRGKFAENMGIDRCRCRRSSHRRELRGLHPCSRPPQREEGKAHLCPRLRRGTQSHSSSLQHRANPFARSLYRS